ncbi:Methyltransferase-like protein 13 [Nymphon striatum]|nr:Methyltransferase-like protein 13 [Nymphon striatum]
MDLLPKTKSEFGNKEYWNKFFQKRGKDSFEWYGEYPQLCLILHKYIKQNNAILGIGCGNSRLCVDLYDVGCYHNNINVDISELAIKSMNQLHTQNRPGLQFIHMDVLKMTFENEKFHVVVDKGTLDAIMSDSSSETEKITESMFNEIQKVLKYGGRYICVSLLQEHIIRKILSWFPSRGWMIRIHRCFEAEQQVDSNNIVFPVFVVIITKMKLLPGASPILELCLEHDESIRRVSDPEKILENLSALQHYAFVRQKLSGNSVLNDQISVELHSVNNSIPRYILYIIDRPAKSNKLKFAIFVVPQGRECEWLFRNEHGQRSLSEKVNCQRLVIVHLSRDHDYTDLESIKSELASKVIELKPTGLPANYQLLEQKKRDKLIQYIAKLKQEKAKHLSKLVKNRTTDSVKQKRKITIFSNNPIPFLSISDDIGQRTVCYRGNSISSGEYVIEEVFKNESYFRRLIFLQCQNIIQSEARLKSVFKKKRRGKNLAEKKQVDLNFLACNHHKFMISGLSFLPSSFQGKTDQIDILLIGLGGGSLAMFLHNNFSSVHLGVVEIDSGIVDIAKKWFDFSEDSRNIVHVDDGINFITSESKLQRKYDIVMLDVDNKDTSLGLSCPPKEFVQPSILNHSHNILKSSGVFIINLVCRDKSLQEKAFEDLKKMFRTILVIQVDDEVNKIVYCLKEKIDNVAEKLEEVKKSLLSLNKITQKCLGNENLVDVTELLKNISLI